MSLPLYCGGSLTHQISWVYPCIVEGFCHILSHESVSVLWGTSVTPDLMSLSLYCEGSLTHQISWGCHCIAEGYCHIRSHESGPAFCMVYVTPNLIRLSLYCRGSWTHKISWVCLCIVEGSCYTRSHESVPVLWRAPVTAPCLLGAVSCTLSHRFLHNFLTSFSPHPLTLCNRLPALPHPFLSSPVTRKN